MILAPTLTLNSPAGARLDADAAAFAATSGATDVAALSNFVKGVKALGLWDNMVCWPLRSSQNAGTGTTAYSLGGLGTFNGTLVNGPTWGVDGVAFSSNAAQHISTNSLFAFTNTCVVFSAFSFATKARRTFLGTNNINNQPSFEYGGPNGANGIAMIGNGLFAATFPVSTSEGQNNAYTYARTGAGAGSHFWWENGIAKSLTVNSFDFLPDTSNPLLGCRAVGLQHWDGNISIVLIANVESVPSNVGQSLHTLYKQTLGAGLSLP